MSPAIAPRFITLADFAECQEPNIGDLASSCGPHHQLITSGGWQTQKHKDGTTEWIPPAHLDCGNRVPTRSST
ncbi:hypothetical protein MB901379_00811 [Mycobacterium basiliense]|uniref:Uncharacterized protein n=1 Tax=Mycobacterium basiliense TaxID=2094119 RepID=A0A3S4BTF0_9MYCO|nr:hypothetical protein MB901379_00811 [Mycobacterium basiliense]